MIAAPFAHCTITASADAIINVFSDGTVRHFWLAGVRDDPEYRRIAEWAGYGSDWYRYAVEHDIAHAFIAEWCGLKWCPVLHDPLDVPLSDAPQDHRDVEHLANRLARYVRTGASDEYGCLETLFADRLDDAACRFDMICERAWHTSYPN